MAATALVGAAIFALRQPTESDTKKSDVVFAISDPSELATALKFGLFLVILVLAVYYLRLWLHDRGLYAVAAVAGLADVDGITLTTARLISSGLGLSAAAATILIAVVINTLVKIAIARVISGTALALWAAAALVPALAVGAAAWAVY